MVERALRYVRDHGVGATARVAAGELRGRLYLDEIHVWYGLDLTSLPEGRPIPEGLRLVRATDADVPMYVALGQASEASTRERLGSGGALWIVTDGTVAAFACWTFERGTPVEAARGGTLRLPETCVCLEDSVTSPDFRGRGVAPGAWSAIAQQLRDEGFTLMITKVGLENAPSRRAVTKAGFVEFAVMRYRRRGPQRRVEVWPDGAARGIDLIAALPARTAAPPAPS